MENYVVGTINTIINVADIERKVQIHFVTQEINMDAITVLYTLWLNHPKSKYKIFCV